MTKTANEVIDEMVEETTLDAYYDRDPRTMTRDDYRDFIVRQRAARARFNIRDTAKQDKRRGQPAAATESDDD